MQANCLREPAIVNDRPLTYENVKYGILVEVVDPNGGGGYHAGCKVHFFNKKGVLIGNYYKFMPYDKLRIRENINGHNRQYQRYFYGKPYEAIKMAAFKVLLHITGKLIRFTQAKMD